MFPGVAVGIAVAAVTIAVEIAMAVTPSVSIPAVVPQTSGHRERHNQDGSDPQHALFHRRSFRSELTR